MAIPSNLTILELLLDPTHREEIERQNEGKIKSINREEMLQNFAKQIKRQMPIEDFVTKCHTLEEHGERIRILKPFFRWIPSSLEFREQFIKSSSTSSTHLEKARCSFNQKNWQESLKFCNQAAATAPPNSPDLASAYYWRSLTLYELNDPVGSLEDLELSLVTNDFPESNDKLAIDLFRTKIKKAMDQSALTLEDSETKSAANENDTGTTLCTTKRQTFVNELFRLKSPNPLAPALESFVKISYDSIRGRHLIVTRDVPIGTTLLLETPIVSILDGTLLMDTRHCHHCLRRNLRRVPCPNCVFAFFCDENCLAAAHPYHQYECPCLPELAAILREGVLENFYLAFKLMCLIGPWKLFEIFKSDRSDKFKLIMGHSKFQRKIDIEGTDPTTGVYVSQSYLPICHLCSILEPQELLFPLVAMMLSHILEVNCPIFFGPKIVKDRSLKGEFRDFLAERIFHHFECFWKNVFSLGIVAEYERSGGENDDDLIRSSLSSPGGFEYQQYCSRIFATASLLNHSCDPNAKLFTKLSLGTTALVSIRPILAGEEILISYGPLFFAEEKSERQQQLVRCYNFECGCVACVNEWRSVASSSAAHNSELDTPQFCCPECSAGVPHEKKTPDKVAEFALNAENNFKCPTCDTQFEENEVLNKYTQIKKAALHARHLLENDCPLQAQEAFRNVLEYFQHSILQPSFDLVINQELFAEAIYKIIHFAK